MKLCLKPSSPDKGAAPPRVASLLTQAPSLAALAAALRVHPSPCVPDGELRMIGQRSSCFN